MRGFDYIIRSIEEQPVDLPTADVLGNGNDTSDDVTPIDLVTDEAYFEESTLEPTSPETGNGILMIVFGAAGLVVSI